MLKWIILGAILIGVVGVGFSLVDVASTGDIQARTVLYEVNADTTGYRRAIGAYDWQFPRDYGAHDEFQTEWWYYTGNLADASGRRFGYQITIFRRSITPPGDAASLQLASSEWRSDQLYMAHFTVTDVTGNAFYHEERFSRNGAELAGAVVDPLYRVWLENWQVIALDEAAQTTRITGQHAENDVAVDFTLEQIKPPALQGVDGLSPKSEIGGFEGNASYYYSLSRLVTSGRITINGETFTVSGTSWKDHEFSTSALAPGALGWDWFGLQFDDDRELMIGYIRNADGTRYTYGGGLLVNADGSTVRLGDNFTIEALGTWDSPHTDAVYPSGWRISVSVPDENGAIVETINFEAIPQIPDQELHGNGIIYWEGAVQITGDVTGWGYVELTGYIDALDGRF